MHSVIVTGSEGLIGKTVCEYLQASGFDVKRADLELGIDLTDRAQVHDFFAENKAESLVNLFGLNHHMEKDRIVINDFLEIPESDLNDYNEVNVTSLFSVCREFMKQNPGRIRIVNFSSLYGITSPKKKSYPDTAKHVGYVTSKHAMIGLTRYIATHFAPRVTANVVCPGGVDNEYMNPVFRSNYCDNVPMERMANARDVCGLVELLCTEKGDYINGAVIPVDGGWTAW